MARAGVLKARFKNQLARSDWTNFIDEIAVLNGRETVGPLLSLLPGALRNRAAVALGASVAHLARQNPEAARNIVRRFMWHMNEESGNIGWGIPEAFAETLVRSPLLAEEFHRVLLSYIIDTGHDDNYCDHAVLRRSCCWAVGRLAEVRPDLCLSAVPALIKLLEDEDAPCRGLAARALGRLPVPPDVVPALRQLAEKNDASCCEVFENDLLRSCTVAELVRETLRRMERCKQISGLNMTVQKRKTNAAPFDSG